MSGDVVGYMLLMVLFLVIAAWGSWMSRQQARKRERVLGKGASFQMPPATEERALALIAAGRRIPAIKAVREDTGMGLKEAKDYVDALVEGRPFVPPYSMGHRSPSWQDVPPHARDRALAHLANGKMIHAVKAVRETTGMGLKEAKDYVEALRDGRVPIPDGQSGMLSERVREFKHAEDIASAVALVRSETGMSREEAERFVASLD